ncbi:hypothetical protein SBF1_2250008 [Candidatus Desulfosporosinus infrequens]|uniref:Uncharacterized protein n=1 Tax=Candidatus Desulfosporosinus infrequens TaxID=2043169 RepID=A0A2U3KLM0_9FIRM|nr:hypothetical protein SBF1_2250008 [Candidatus Desulfosporosinus infrequens]
MGNLLLYFDAKAIVLSFVSFRIVREFSLEEYYVIIFRKYVEICKIVDYNTTNEQSIMITGEKLSNCHSNSRGA